MRKILVFSAISMLCACNTTDQTKEEEKIDLKTISVNCDCSEIDVKRNALGEKIDGSLVYDLKTKEAFTGRCEEKYGNGDRKEIREYSNGKLHGSIESWDENGLLRRHLNYKDGIQDGEQLVWNEKKKVVVSESFKNGNHGENGFKYKNEALEFIWFNTNGRTTKDVTFYNPKSYSIVIQKTLFSKNEKPYYEIYINDKLNDDVILNFVKSVIDNHFTTQNVSFNLNIDFVRGDKNQPDINIGYIEDEGWLTEEAKQKEKDERIRIFKLLSSSINKVEWPNI